MEEEKKSFKDTAKYRANNKYISANYKQVKLSMPNEEADTLKAFCEAQNIAVAGLIRSLVKKEISTELKFDPKEKDFLLMANYADGSSKVIGSYAQKEDGIEEGKKFIAESPRGVRATLIKGNLDDNGNIIGAYLLFENWK